MISMLKVYYGNDTVRSRQQAFNHIEEQQQRGVTIEYIDADNYQSGIFSAAVGSVSLFGGEWLYMIDMPSTASEFYDDVINHLEAFAVSPNEFIVIEGALLAKEKAKFTKWAESMEEYKSENSTRFNTFDLADAFAHRDKKSLWLLFNDARYSGIALEEIIGVLWWQLKTLRLAALTDSAAKAGLKEYPYSKAKRALMKFKTGEIESLSHQLLALQHDSRLGLCELDIALERWILSL